MKEILLNRKWIGAAALMVYSLIVAFLFTNFIVDAVKKTAPIVQQELADFLPITISDGEIVEPKERIISKTYGSGKDERKIVLDTNVEEFITSDLKDKGLFISRKYIYVVSDSRTEVRDLKNIPNMTIDREVLQEIAETAETKAGIYIFFGIFVAFWAVAAAVIGLYTLAMHWALTGVFHNQFAQTLRINTFAYIVVSALSMIAGFNIGIIATFVILGAANYAVNKWLVKEQKA